MARGRRAGHGDLLNLRRAAAFLAVVSLSLAACGLVPTAAPSISRGGTTLVVNVPGYNLSPSQGFLCPSDPGVGATTDEAGLGEIREAGCLDLGRNDDASGGWTARVNLESLSSAQLEAFANRPTYRLVLVALATTPFSVFAADVPVVSLVP